MVSITELKEKIANIPADDIKLFFITRVLKDNFRKSSKVMEKYLFKVYQVEVDSEIREYLLTLSIDQLEYIAKRDFELHEYDVISDDTEHLFTYSMTNKAMSFADVVYNQLRKIPPKVKSIEEIIKSEELWAYCVGFNDVNAMEWIYSFRKILASKVAIDEQKNIDASHHIKFIRALFNTQSQKLEILKGETVNLDKQIDCIYYGDTFYIIRKGNFEQIIGLEEEFKQQAIEVASQIESTNMVVGIDIIKKQIEKNPSLHKKLVRIAKIGTYSKLDEETIKKMAKVCEEHGDNLKLQNGKLLIEEPKDIDRVLKMFADYYKRGEVSGKHYGTFAGKELAIAQVNVVQ